MRKAYISYSRRSADSIIERLTNAAEETDGLITAFVEDGCEARLHSLNDGSLSETYPDKWALVYDDIGMGDSGSITGFMETLSLGEQVVFLLSKGYFQSPYCMTELMLIYNRRASELIPIVVFVDDFELSPKTKDSILDDWTKRESEAREAQEFKKAEHAKRVVDSLENAIAWLLGEFDKTHNNYDATYWKDDKTEKSAREIIKRILNPVPKPPYPFSSAQKLNDEVVKSIDKVFSRNSTKDWFATLLDEHLPYHDSAAETAGERFVSLGSAEQVMRFIEGVESWLEDILEDSEPSSARAKLAGNVKTLLGWVLLSCMDVNKVTCLLHRLNHKVTRSAQTVKPTTELNEESPIYYQLLASAISATQIVYRRDTSSNQYIGKGQMRMPETGVDYRNGITAIEQESEYRELNLFRIKTDLVGQVLSSMQGNDAKPVSANYTRGDIDDGLRVHLRGAPDHFLLLDKAHEAYADHEDFCRELVRLYPGLKIMVACGYQKGGEMLQGYLAEGYSQGELKAHIERIYSLIDRLLE